jgi:hypothetical protein
LQNTRFIIVQPKISLFKQALRVFQAQTISPGICAGALLLVCFLIEYAISIKLFDKASAHQVALWVSGLAGILEVGGMVWLLIDARRFDPWSAIKRVLHP